MGIETTLGMFAGLANSMGFVETGVSLLEAGAAASSAIGGAGTAIGALSSGASILGGIQGYNEGQQQYEYALASADLQGKELARQSVAEAAKERESYQDTIRRQKIAYLASGVTLEGSPLAMMETTRTKGVENVNEILESGASASSTASLEGRVKANSLKSSARQSLISGLTGAGSSLFKMAA